jgi:hypothetical protein
VDDDPAVLDVSSDWADVHGDVDWLTASDPQRGLELLSTHDVDCLVSDSFRTDDGDPFVTHAAATFPDLSVVLFTSMDYDDLDPDVRDSRLAYVEKGVDDPFDALFGRILTVTDDSTPSRPATGPAPRPTTRGDDERWIPIGRYRPEEGDDLATVIVTAVEAHTDRDASTFPRLYDAVDADAVASLLRRGDGRPRDGVQVRFVYADHELVVTGDGVVLVRD